MRHEFSRMEMNARAGRPCSFGRGFRVTGRPSGAVVPNRVYLNLIFKIRAMHLIPLAQHLVVFCRRQHLALMPEFQDVTKNVQSQQATTGGG